MIEKMWKVRKSEKLIDNRWLSVQKNSVESSNGIPITEAVEMVMGNENKCNSSAHGI